MERDSILMKPDKWLCQKFFVHKHVDVNLDISAGIKITTYTVFGCPEKLYG